MSAEVLNLLIYIGFLRAVGLKLPQRLPRIIRTSSIFGDPRKPLSVRLTIQLVHCQPATRQRIGS